MGAALDNVDKIIDQLRDISVLSLLAELRTQVLDLEQENEVLTKELNKPLYAGYLITQHGSTNEKRSKEGRTFTSSDPEVLREKFMQHVYNSHNPAEVSITPWVPDAKIKPGKQGSAGLDIYCLEHCSAVCTLTECDFDTTFYTMVVYAIEFIESV